MSSQEFIGYGRQSIDQSDLDAVVEALQGDFLTQGPAVLAFEEALAAYVGAKHAVAVSNGTAALHVACLAAGVKTGDLGVTQPITFAASANCLLYCGADAQLVDIDPDSLTMAPRGLERFLGEHPQTKVIIPVAYAGLSSNGAQLRKVAGDRIIIEDGCHALGGEEPEGAKVGSCTHSDMCVFSFHPVKPLTTGEGGAITTNDPSLYKKMLAYRSHGIVRGRENIENPEEADNPWYYEQQTLGYNYRLPDILAALGTSQLQRLDDFRARRRAVADIYDRAFAEVPNLTLVQNQPDQRARSGHHLYVVRLDYEAIGLSRKQVMDTLREHNIGTQVHYIPVHQLPFHKNRLSEGQQAFPVSNSYYQECLTIPCYPTLKDEDVARVIAAITDIVTS